MTHEAWMARAIRLARRGLYTTDPNPRVGCVLVKDGRLVAEGWHRKAGEPHAERMALASAGADARGATAYVTLEPCCHHGRTPPCSDALIEAGVARVVVAMQDPNPLVAGQGVAQLREAGIEVIDGVLEAGAAALNPGFIKRMSQGMPYVRCKLAMSLDGRTAMADGESKWITSDASRRDVHRLRARSSAIVTGIGTVLADDPSMTVRLPAEALDGIEREADIRQPLRVVLDTHLALSPDAAILGQAGETVVVTTSDDDVLAEALMAAGATLLRQDLSDAIDLAAVLAQLADTGMNEVLIEAGANLACAAISAGVVDELVIYMAPHLMGDAARGLLHLPGIGTMAQRIPLTLSDLRLIGPDIRLTYSLRK
ncbi:MAG: bifunctional diaminohydroxyphosphoribosylaminopyrimidine deaminase/5-amino-6-(5-phosphoribosylamino)uracil reductase RibD [Gammaproteobacteria bacterium]